MEKEQYLIDLERLYRDSGEKEKDIECAIKYASNLLNYDLPVIMSKEHFCKILGFASEELWFMTKKTDDFFYHNISIPKKSGGIREIQAPAKSLKFIQQWILKNILSKLPISKYATGFCKNKSIVTNAEIHAGKKCIVNMDMKDFFPSIDQKQVYRIFYYYGYTAQVSFLLSKLCTYDGHLPQGAPTSPYISNIVCLKLDKRLSSLASKYDAKYSRYADDITFSSDKNISVIIPVVTSIIQDEGFNINPSKTRYAYNYQRQEVTGLIVNNGVVTIPKQYKKKFKQEIYYCKKYGAENHLQHIGCNKLFYRDHMYGKAYFIFMVEPDLGKELLKELDSVDWGY